jgi:hypothetical protein
MPRLARHAFTALSAVSLLLCVVVGFFWAYDRNTPFSWELQFTTNGGQTRWKIYLWGNAIVAGRITLPELRDADPRFVFRRTIGYSVTANCFFAVYEYGTVWRHLGHFGATCRSAPPEAAHLVLVPTWFALVTSLAMPLLWMISAVKRSIRSRPGLCSHCGYDLRASPDRCPECGAVARGHSL